MKFIAGIIRIVSEPITKKLIEQLSEKPDFSFMQIKNQKNHGWTQTYIKNFIKKEFEQGKPLILTKAGTTSDCKFLISEFKLFPKEVMVITYDYDLPFGKIKVKLDSSYQLFNEDHKLLVIYVGIKDQPRGKKLISVLDKIVDFVINTIKNPDKMFNLLKYQEAELNYD